MPVLRAGIIVVCLTFTMFVLAGCGQENPARVSYCLAAAVALEPDGERLMIGDIEAQGPSVAVDYAREAQNARHQVVCQFAGGAYEINQLDLVDVTRDGHGLGPGQFTFLKRYWLPRFSALDLSQRIVMPAVSSISLGNVPGQILQMILSALPLAAVYALLAAGFALIHGIIGRVSVAHGEFATVGAYAGYTGFMALGTWSGMLGPLGAVTFALIATAAAAWMTAQAVFVPLARRTGQMFLVASVGLVLVYEEIIRITSNAHELWLPPLLSSPISLTGPPFIVTITPMQMLVVAASAVPLAALLLALTFTRFGKQWRAVSDDPMAAQLMGIDPAAVLRVSAVTAGCLAGWAGLGIMSAYGNANHSMGLMLGLKAMVAAIAGGMGSVGGAIAGAIVLVAIETAWVGLFGGGYRDAAVFILLIGLLTLSPAGLLGRGRL